MLLILLDKHYNVRGILMIIDIILMFITTYVFVNSLFCYGKNTMIIVFNRVKNDLPLAWECNGLASKL